MQDIILFPETLPNWTWKRQINPLYEEVAIESSEWITGFRAFGPNAQKAFDKCKYSLLASLAYPLANRDVLFAGCNLMNLFFVIDDPSDNMNVEDVQKIADVVMDAFHNAEKPRPTDEWVGGEISRQLWLQITRCLDNPLYQNRFRQTFGAYLDSVVRQAAVRQSTTMLTVEEYMVHRRDNIGLYPSLVLLEADKSRSEEAVDHPLMKAIEEAAADICIIGNDLVSFNKEQCVGDEKNNLVFIVMCQFNLDVQRAIDWVADYNIEAIRRFQSACDEFDTVLPRWGDEADADARAYIDGVGNWIRASNEWSYESGRYFGTQGHQVRTKGYFYLLPKKKPQEGTVEIVEQIV